MSIQGIHHITAVASDPQSNFEFYTGVMGLRLVKKTVNFDDPSTYHLYYGNGSGEPGTILTFFPWQHLRQGEPDRGEVVAVSFSIPPGSTSYWLERLHTHNLEIEAPFDRFGKEVIGVKDPDGLHLELIADPGADETGGWSDGSVPAEHAIRGLHGATIAEKNYAPTGMLLEEELGFSLCGQSGDRYRYETDARFGSVIEIIDQFELNGKPGKGTVHHIAFRAGDNEEQNRIRDRLLNTGYYLTEIKDRLYFHSVYFHEPGGALFEIATDAPGFTADETLENLGTSLKLPPWLENENQRNSIMQNLPPLN